MPHRIYFWRVQNRNGRWYRTRFRTTEEHIRKEHPEAERIETDFMEIADAPARMYDAVYGVKHGE